MRKLKSLKRISLVILVILTANSCGTIIKLSETPLNKETKEKINQKIVENNSNTEEKILSKKWIGKYYQENNNCSFEMDINIDKNIITGFMYDNNNNICVGDAKISGEINGSNIKFTKYYYTVESSPVYYTGTISNDYKNIKGKWKLESGENGEWEANSNDSNQSYSNKILFSDSFEYDNLDSEWSLEQNPNYTWNNRFIPNAKDGSRVAIVNNKEDKIYPFNDYGHHVMSKEINLSNSIHPRLTFSYKSDVDSTLKLYWSESKTTSNSQNWKQIGINYNTPQEDWKDIDISLKDINFSHGYLYFDVLYRDIEKNKIGTMIDNIKIYEQ
jgi:hypothetical protein